MPTDKSWEPFKKDMQDAMSNLLETIHVNLTNRIKNKLPKEFTEDEMSDIRIVELYERKGYNKAIKEIKEMLNSFR
jgi:hypothetical protein